MSLSENDQKEILRMRKKLDGIRGPGVRHTRESIYIDAPPRDKPEKPRRPKPELVFVRALYSTVNFTSPTTGNVTTVTLGGGKTLACEVTGTFTVPTTQANLEAVLNISVDAGLDEDSQNADADILLYNLAEDGFGASHNLTPGSSFPYLWAWDLGLTASVTVNGDARSFRIMLADALRTEC